MSLTRVTAWTLLLAGGFALLAPSAAHGQNPLPKKNSEATATVTRWRDEPRGGIPKEELKRVREQFRLFAKYYADVVAHPDVWKAPQELKSTSPLVVPPPTLDGPNGILQDIDRFVIEPGVTRTTNLEPTDYVRELGAAFDDELKKLIEESPDMIVRVNAARVLAHVARTGAPAHYPTVAALLQPKANTPGAVKNYLFQAAGALLAAPDLYDLKVRKHGSDPQTVGKLVKALQDSIDDPALLVPGVSLDKPETLTEDQQLVIGYLRREAVRALAKVKFVRVPGPDGKTPIYPAYTLVRVAMSDPALVPPPGPAEAADAAIGLCNMAPVEQQLNGTFRVVKEFNSDVAVEAVTAAMVTFAKPRAADPLNRALPWRLYAARFGEALRNWRPLFDPDFEITRPANFNAQLVPAGLEMLNREIVPMVLAPMDKTDSSGKPDAAARIRIEELQQRLAGMKNRPKRNTLLFSNVPATTIDFPPPRKEPPPAPKKEPEAPKKEAEPPKKEPAPPKG